MRVRWRAFRSLAILALACLLAAGTLTQLGSAQAWSTSASGSGRATAGIWVCTIAATVRIDPQHLNGSSEGQDVTVSVAFPPGTLGAVTVDQIDPAAVTMRVQGGSATISALPSPFNHGDNQRMLKFRRSDVVGLLDGQSGQVTLVVAGPAGACTFSGTDTIDYAPAEADVALPKAATESATAAQPAAVTSATTTAHSAPVPPTTTPQNTPVTTAAPTTAVATATPSGGTATSDPPPSPAPTPTPTVAALSASPVAGAGSPDSTPVPTPVATPDATPTPASVATPEPAAVVGIPTSTPTPTTGTSTPTTTTGASTPATTPAPPNPIPSSAAPVVPPTPTPAQPPAPPSTVVARLLAHYVDAGTLCGQLWLRSEDPAGAGQTIVLRLTYRDAPAADWNPTESTATVTLIAGQLRYDTCLPIPDALRQVSHAALLRLEIDSASTATLTGPVPTSEPLPWIPALVAGAATPSPAATPTAAASATPSAASTATPTATPAAGP